MAYLVIPALEALKTQPASQQRPPEKLIHRRYFRPTCHHPRVTQSQSFEDDDQSQEQKLQELPRRQLNKQRG